MVNIIKDMDLKSDRYYMTKDFTHEDVDFLVNNFHPIDAEDFKYMPFENNLLNDITGQYYRRLKEIESAVIIDNKTGKPHGVISWVDDDNNRLTWISYASTNIVEKTDYKFALVRGLKNMIKKAKYDICADVLKDNYPSLRHLKRYGFKEVAESDTYITLIKEKE